MAFSSDVALDFLLKEKIFSLSGDDFQITCLTTEEHMYKVKGNWMSVHDSKILFDSSGTAIYKMSSKVLTLRDRMFIEDCETKEKYFTLRKKGIVPIIGTNTIRIWRGAEDDGEPDLEIKGNILHKQFDVVEKRSGRVLCEVKRKGFNVRNLVFNSDTYCVRVCAGANVPLMVFLVIAIDENYRDG